MSERSERMSDAEALMWNVEKDPWLSANVGALSILDGPVDVERFRRKVAHAVVELPRLHQRAQAVLGRLTPPTWVDDEDFDLDHHLRVVGAPGPTLRDVTDLATQLLQDPFDRTRPLWQFTLITGLGGGRTALFSKLHHTVTDGQGGVQLAERYMELTAEGEEPGAIDVRASLAQRSNGTDQNSIRRAAAETAAHALRRNLGRTRRLAADAMLATADPGRVPEWGAELLRTLSDVRNGLDREPDAGSDLWVERSRRRRFETDSVSFRPVLDAARMLGGTVNDVFVTAALDGAARYHQEAGSNATRLNVTFVMSTRTSADSETSNAFTPSRVALPAGVMDVKDRFAAVHAALAERKAQLRGRGLLADVAGIANLLPTSVITRFARGQARDVDLATSNVRAAPFPVFVGGARVMATFPMGPVAGTAANLTVLSYAGRLDLGLHVDASAVEKPDRLMALITGSLDELVRQGGQEPGRPDMV